MSGSAASAEPTDPRYPWKMLGVVVLGTLLSALNASTVNVCLPSMMASFGASVDDIQWVVTAYMLGFSTLMPLTVWLRDRLGHRTLYILSLVVFTVGSVLCGVAWSLPVLLLARVVQAFGGGALTPTAMAMIAEAFPPAERGRALGIWGVGMIVGPAIGPTLGGYLTEAFGWRAIFDVNVPFALVGLLTAVSILRHDRPPTTVRRPFDPAGFVLLSAFLVALLLGLSKGNVEGWSSRYVLTCWVVAGFSFAGFLLVESVVEHGILDLGLLRHGQLTIALVVTAVRSVALYGGTFLLPVFLQTHMGLDEIRTGELLLPGAVVLGAMMPFSGRLADRIGARLPTVAGLLATATFMFMYRELDSATSTWGILAPMLIRGIGIGLIYTPVMTAAMNAVPTSSAGMASSMLNLVQQVAGSVGIAVLASVLGTRTVYHRALVGESLQGSSAAWSATASAVGAHLRGLGYGPADARLATGAMMARHAVETASVAAFDDAFFVGGLIVLCGIVPALFLASRARAQPRAAPGALAD
jgi:MFS transporter, DHA2 family, multidrug resistance protein